jgi:hypothetical protein
MFPSFSRLLPALMLPLTGMFTNAAGQSLLPAHTTVVKQVYQNERGRPVNQAQAHQYAVISRRQPDGSRTHTRNDARGETTLYTVETFSRDGTRLSWATYQALHEPVDWEQFGDPAFGQALRQGLCYEYHPGGQVKFEGRFVQGQAQGLHRRYYPNGKLSTTIPFVILKSLCIYSISSNLSLLKFVAKKYIPIHNSKTITILPTFSFIS